MSAELGALIPRCEECGRLWLPDDEGRWRCYRLWMWGDDLVVYCPECAKREFDCPR